MAGANDKTAKQERGSQTSRSACCDEEGRLPQGFLFKDYVHMKEGLPIDRARFARPYMRIVAATGGAITLFAAYCLPSSQLRLPFFLLAGVTVGVGSRIVVKFFRFKSCISLSDIFIFLTLLLFDGEAAILVAALEGFFSSLRITKKPLTMTFNLASMAWSTFVTVWVLRLCSGPLSGPIKGLSLRALL